MEKILNIDGKDVRFVATAATPMRYRNRFGRDLLLDMQQLADAMDTKKGNLDIASLEVFENVAYIMAYTGAEDRNAFPTTPIDWLEEFEMFSIYDILPELLDLWKGNTKTLNTSKKK